LQGILQNISVKNKDKNMKTTMEMII
jgi:hypothetical protein